MPRTAPGMTTGDGMPLNFQARTTELAEELRRAMGAPGSAWRPRR